MIEKVLGVRKKSWWGGIGLVPLLAASGGGGPVGTVRLNVNYPTPMAVLPKPALQRGAAFMDIGVKFLKRDLKDDLKLEFCADWSVGRLNDCFRFQTMGWFA